MTRAQRARLIRSRVVAGAVALFVAAWLAIAITLISGNDPALSRNRATTSAATTAAAATTTSSSGSTSLTQTTTTPSTTTTTTPTSSAAASSVSTHQS